MMQDILSVREITQDDIGTLIQYWFRADHEFLKGMGVDVGKMPSPDQFSEMLERQINTPIESRASYCLIWELNGRAVGHTNTNPTKYGEEAFMHLHLWNIMDRKKGIGSELLKQSLPLYFTNLQLKELYCQPYALNPAPNRTLEKLGFEFVKEYVTTPGFINFEQPVKLWRMSNEKFQRH